MINLALCQSKHKHLFLPFYNKLLFSNRGSFLPLLLLFFLINYTDLLAEGTAALAPSTDDNTALFIGAGNTGPTGGQYGQFAWKGSDSKFAFNIQNTCEKVYFGFSHPLNNREFDLINPRTGAPGIDESLIFRIIDPMGNPINDLACFGNVTINGEVWQRLNSTTANIANRSEATNGPTQLGNGNGYAAFELDLTNCGLNLTGNYFIEFFTTKPAYDPNTNTSGFYLEFFDVTVADCNNQAITGRVWSNNWSLAIKKDGNGLFDRAFNGAFYVCSTAGFITKIDFNSQTNTRPGAGNDNDQRSGFRAGSFNVSFNRTGPANTGNILTDRQSLQNVNAPNPELMVFLNLPDEATCPEQPIGTFRASTKFLTGCPTNRCINLESTQSGQLEILIEDKNGNGILDLPTDRLLAYEITENDKVANLINPDFTYAFCLPWDGKDGLGNLIDASKMTVTGYYSQGVFHFPVYDAEYNDDGFLIETIRPALGPQLLHYDDSQIIENNNTGESKDGTNGCNAPCHTWTGEYEPEPDKDDVYGNFNTINTWWFANTEAKDLTTSIKQEGIFTITCPPDFNACPDSDISPDKLGFPAIVPNDLACAYKIEFVDEKLGNNPLCEKAATINRVWTVTLEDDPNKVERCTQLIVLIDTIAPLFEDCPADITIEAEEDCEANLVLTVPTATDNCTENVTVSSSHATNFTFPIGITLVTYTAKDDCGNEATCQFTVTVEGDTKISCPADIIAQCDPQKRLATISWEPPSGNECCNSCETDTEIDGFEFLGERGGHRYYLSNLRGNWEQAKTAAAQTIGDLVVIDDPAENQFLTSFLRKEYISAYIGLSDEASEGTFYWMDGSPMNYTNWHKNQPNDWKSSQDAGQLMYNGKWNDAYGTENLQFLLEVSCFQVRQVEGPLNGSTFPEGTTTTIRYEVSYDNCIKPDTCSFTVTVEDCPDNYCKPYATDQKCFWIERVQIGTIDNTSGNNGGYADFSHLSTDVLAGSTQTINLYQGFPPNHTFDTYWMVWIDYNHDGDFEDAGEHLFTVQKDRPVNVDFTIPKTAKAGQTRMRVILKWIDDPSPCNPFVSGEIEDYSINILPLVPQRNVINGAVLTFENNKFKDLESKTPSLATARALPIDEISSEAIKILLFPNPASDYIKVQLEDDFMHPTRLRIYNRFGQVVQEQPLTTRLKEPLLVSIRHLTDGMYLLSIEGTNGTIGVQKFNKFLSD